MLYMYFYLGGEHLLAFNDPPSVWLQASRTPTLNLLSSSTEEFGLHNDRLEETLLGAFHFLKLCSSPIAPHQGQEQLGSYLWWHFPVSAADEGPQFTSLTTGQKLWFLFKW